jgi:hypothetical protein
MPDEIRIESLEDAARYIYTHEGKINAWWDAQHRLNVLYRHRFEALEIRISSVEKRVIWASGVAAGLGAVFGSLLQVFFAVGG